MRVAPRAFPGSRVSAGQIPALLERRDLVEYRVLRGHRDFRACQDSQVLQG